MFTGGKSKYFCLPPFCYFDFNAVISLFIISRGCLFLRI
nr:MAG TPA: hypothetical protein [Caudoviricetes sp.]DAM26226.1 MAG TPA: hypothetical protein [Caudoviricetes sp.]